jgi:hypothetical protein
MKPFKAQTVATIDRLDNEKPTLMWGTGANRSGTNNKSIHKNVTECDPITIIRLFRTPHKGELGSLKPDTVVIDDMGPQTIISVYRVYQLGQVHIALFIHNNFRVYTLDTAMKAIKLLTHDGKEVVRGTV